MQNYMDRNNEETRRGESLQENINEKTLIVLVGFGCNCSCVMCSVDSGRKEGVYKTFDEIEYELDQGISQGFTSVEYSGGEPTMREDISELVAVAKEIGYASVAMSSNGRKFLYKEFCEAIVGAGLDKVSVSLHGSCARIHDAVTRTPEAWEQTVKGLKNLLSCSGLEVEVCTQVSQINYKDLKEIGSLLKDIGVRKWNLLDLIPDGEGLRNYRGLVIGFDDLKSVVNNLGECIGEFERVSFFDFPVCLFEKDFLDLENVEIVDALGRRENAEQVGYKSDRIEVGNESVIDKYKEYRKECEECEFLSRCGGKWKLPHPNPSPCKVEGL